MSDVAPLTLPWAPQLKLCCQSVLALSGIQHCLSRRLGSLGEVLCVGNQRDFPIYPWIEISFFVLRKQRGWDLEINLSLWHMVFWDILTNC